MIQSFKGAATHDLFVNGKHRDFTNIAKVALRKLDRIQAAVFLEDLKIPSGNRLEALKRDRLGQHSIRINSQYRICFEWKTDGAHNVEIVDYH
jgi:proteic killer suppression protein